MAKTLKLKKCIICNTKFPPFSSLSKTCSVPCSIESVALAKDKQESRMARRRTRVKKKALRERKKKLLSRSDHLRMTQTVINKYVRLRDAGKPCCSCDKPDNGQHQRHASHFKSVGSNSALRFNLWNINASCSQCNNHLSGNIGEYKPRLIKKIGIEKVEWLESQNHPVKYEIDYLIRLKKIFSKRVRLKEVKS